MLFFSTLSIPNRNFLYGANDISPSIYVRAAEISSAYHFKSTNQSDIQIIIHWNDRRAFESFELFNWKVFIRSINSLGWQFKATSDSVWSLSVVRFNSKTWSMRVYTNRTFTWRSKLMLNSCFQRRTTNHFHGHIDEPNERTLDISRDWLSKFPVFIATNLCLRSLSSVEILTVMELRCWGDGA